MTLIDAAAATLTVDSRLPQEHFCSKEMGCAVVKLGFIPDEVATGLYLPGTRRWESGLLIATMVKLNQQINDPDGRWAGFTLDNTEHYMALIELASLFPQARRNADEAIDMHAITDVAASDLGQAGFIETRTITLPGDEENGGKSVTVIFPTTKLVEELRRCYGG